MRRREVLMGANLLHHVREVAADPEGEFARMRSMGRQPCTEEAEEIYREIIELKRGIWRQYRRSWSGSIAQFIGLATEVFGTDSKVGTWSSDTWCLIFEVEAGARPREDLYKAANGRKVRGVETLMAGSAAPEADRGPTTVCSACDATVPVADTWVNKKGIALCEGCFTKREAKGRARKGRVPEER